MGPWERNPLDPWVPEKSFDPAYVAYLKNQFKTPARSQGFSGSTAGALGFIIPDRGCGNGQALQIIFSNSEKIKTKAT